MNLAGLTTIDLMPAVLVFARISAMVFTLPVISSRTVPVLLKLAGALALSWSLFPLVHQTQVDPVGMTMAGTSTLAVAWGLGLVHEILIGAAIGFSARVLMAGVHVCSAVIESLSGLTFGLPESVGRDDGQGALRQLFWWTTLAVFVANGGASTMFAGVLASFHQWPVGSRGFDESLLMLLTGALGTGFEFALRAALPGVAAMLVASAVLGLVQKNCPQLGGMQVGLGLKAAAGLVVTSLLLISAPWVISAGFEDTFARLGEWLSPSRAGN